MSSSKIEHSDVLLTDEAWQRLQKRLALEPAQPKWAAWPPSQDSSPEQMPVCAAVPAAAAEAPLPGLHAGDPAPDQPRMQERSGAQPAAGWLRKRRKWAALAAACCVFAAFVATPAGNKALASMLNKFRMQDVTVVQENDLQNLFKQMSSDGQTREQINKFGTFTHTSGKLQGQYRPEEAAKLLGRKLVVPQVLTAADKPQDLYISPSNKLTFQIKVDEVNAAMKRLGAKQLLPASIDGKPITLELGETVNFNMRDESKKVWYTLSQQPVPVVTVDSSIPVSEALKAVLDFPLLPSYLKEGLQKSNILNGGSVPLPVIGQQNTEQVTVNGTNVIVTASPSKEQNSYYATWVKDGQLFNLAGDNRYTDRASMLDKIKELISQ